MDVKFPRPCDVDDQTLRKRCICVVRRRNVYTTNNQRHTDVVCRLGCDSSVKQYHLCLGTPLLQCLDVLLLQYSCDTAIVLVLQYSCDNAIVLVLQYSCDTAIVLVLQYSCGTAIVLVLQYSCDTAIVLVLQYSCDTAIVLVLQYRKAY